MSAQKALYDEDFYLWTQRAAELLRAGRPDQVDLENVAEEIESLGKSDKRELRSRLKVLIMHLLKCQQSSEVPSRSWLLTIRSQRSEIRTLLEESPSLKRMVPELVAQAYREAADLASYEMDQPAEPFPARCPFSEADILDDSFVPGRGAG